MKRHLAILLLFGCSLITSAQQNKWFTIKAFLPQWNGAEISLFSNNHLLYTQKVVKDIFDYTGNIDSVAQASLKINSGKNIFYIPVFLEPGTIRIRDAGSRVLVSFGTPSNDRYVAVNKSFDSLAAQKKNISFSEALQYKRELASTFIRNNPSSIVSAQLLKDYYYLTPEANDTLYYSLVYSLAPLLQQEFYVKEMMKEATTRFMTAIGKIAPVLKLPDSTGSLQALYKHGQYTLINFWASWCVPCRKENPELIKLYGKYHADGFEITGIAFDTKRLLWLNAIRHDKLAWPQLNDFNGWTGFAAEMYGIKIIPMNYLINREGIIIAKNLNVEQLDKLLKSLLDKTSNSEVKLF